MDHKPFLSNLQSMAKSTELFDQASSSHQASPAPSNQDTKDDTDPPTDADRSTATLAQMIAAAVSSAINTAKRMDSSPPHLPEATTQFLDMEIRLSSRTLLDMDLGHIQVVCTACSTTVEARRKIRDCSCVANEPKFVRMDFSKLAHHDASGDLGTMVLAQQTKLDKFRTGASRLIWHTSSKSHLFPIFTTTGP
jgi:hypothetical protein